MLSKNTTQQFERALATAEATLTLLREQLSEERQQRLSDIKAREAFESQFTQLFTRMDNQLVKVEDKLDALHEQAGVPARDIPTIEELVEQAKADPARRKVLEQTLSELEFADPVVGFN